MKPYPLLFHPILKPRVWGGRSLEALGKKLPPHERIGESWEVADLPETVKDSQSIIANGELAGLTLRQAIAQHQGQIMGAAKLTNGGFPLLIKFLDARENLSVQVHPDETYAAAHPEAHLKSEAWVVVQADPGAKIYKGINAGVTPNEFADHIRSGEVVNDLISVAARVGDCHYLSSGTCHALGAGVVVAEIQTPSDTTFRVYDWGRPATSGRELHIKQALQCINFQAPVALPQPQPQWVRDRSLILELQGMRTTELVESEFFSITRIDALQNISFEIVTSGIPEVWMMIQGNGSIHIGNEMTFIPGPGSKKSQWVRNSNWPKVDLIPGITALIPAELSDAACTLDAGAWLLRVRLPSPLKGMIA